MPIRRQFWGFSLFSIGLCAIFAYVTSTHIGIFGDGGTADFFDPGFSTGAFYGGIGLGIGLTALGTLFLAPDFGIFRDRMLRLDGLASYIVLAFAITAAFGLVFRNLISASLFASGVGFLALLGIVALYGITFMGGLGGTTGHRAQWRKGIGSFA